MKQMLRAIKSLEHGDIKTATGTAEEAMREDPRWPEGYVSLGGIYLEGGSPERARGAFLKALQLQAYSAGALAGLGVAEFALGQVPQSREHVKRAVALDPTLKMVRDAERIVSEQP